jgi:L-malate glycosyltransferase
LKNNLTKADRILSTSKAMAIEAGRYTSKNIIVTPFGVDTTLFKPAPDKKEQMYKDAGIAYNKEDVVIGTIKVLDEKYGIKYLVKAFSLVKKKHPQIPIKLLIVGDGAKLVELKLLAKELEIEAFVHFTGFVDYSKIAAYHNMLDIAVFPSMHDSESFGVAALEASACGTAVIASNVGGLPEVVEDGVTGILTPPANAPRLAEAIEKLVLNKELRKEFGSNGRARAERLYEWNGCVRQMIEIYQETMKKDLK